MACHQSEISATNLDCEICKSIVAQSCLLSAITAAVSSKGAAEVTIIWTNILPSVFRTVVHTISMTSSTDDLERIKRCDNVIADILAISGTPSLSYTAVRRGVTLHTAHLGFRDVEAKLTPNDQTRYNINFTNQGIVSAVAVMLNVC